MKRRSIGMKLFWTIAVIMLANILVTLLFGNSLMERFYLEHKKNELTDAYEQLAATIQAQGSSPLENAELAELIPRIEQGNINILIFSVNADGYQEHYYSRGHRLPSPDSHTPAAIPPLSKTERPEDAAPEGQQQQGKSRAADSGLNPESRPFLPRYDVSFWLQRAEDSGFFASQSLPLVIVDSDGDGPFQVMALYSRLPDGGYLFLNTPQEPIALAASLALQYNLYISLFTFVLAAVAVYFVSRRFTRPIMAIDQAARRISQMDFSQPCHIVSGDELEDLSHSINIMAGKLQAYIGEMRLSQTLLEKDLAREAKTSQLRKEFITNVSHDFKTPLTLIRAYTESLLEQLDTADGEKRHSCEIILKESARMSDLITRLLQLSKLESGIVTLEQSLFPIDTLISDILHSSQILIQGKGLRVAFDPGEEDHFVYGDYLRIQQALQNLIENAVKYCPENGRIIIQSANLPADRYRFAITNTSPPLSQDELENIFVSFYKQDQSRKYEEKSFGLGLAIFQAVMQLHQQPCGAGNTPDGLCFWFELPGAMPE